MKTLGVLRHRAVLCVLLIVAANRCIRSTAVAGCAEIELVGEHSGERVEMSITAFQNYLATRNADTFYTAVPNSLTSEILSVRVTIQLHYDLRCARSIFGTFVAHPEMRWRNSEPEKGLRIKIADHIQNTKVREHFEFIAFEFARGSSHLFFPSIFETDAV